NISLSRPTALWLKLTVMRCTHRRQDNAAAGKKFLGASIRENHRNCRTCPRDLRQVTSLAAGKRRRNASRSARPGLPTPQAIPVPTSVARALDRATDPDGAALARASRQRPATV